MSKCDFSVIIPCYNEEGAIRGTLEDIHEALKASDAYEIIVVNDGSTDRSAEILERAAEEFPRLRVVTNNPNRGYGGALKAGIYRARGDLIVITDADGTYPNHRILEFVEECKASQLDMLVGARTGEDVTYSRIRAIPKVFLKAWASWIAGQHIPDINSGFRVFRRELALRFQGILPNSFSLTTTITLAMLTNYMAVGYLPINYKSRVGKSKIQPIRDTLRFCALILRTGMYFAPVRLLFPFILLLGFATAISVAHDFVVHNLTDTSVILAMSTLNLGCFALLADMIDKRSAR